MVQLGAVIWAIDTRTNPFGYYVLGEKEWNCRSHARMCAESIKITGISQESVDGQSLRAIDVLLRFKAWALFICNNSQQAELEQDEVKQKEEPSNSTTTERNSSSSKASLTSEIRGEISNASRFIVHYNGHQFDMLVIILELMRAKVDPEFYFQEWKLDASLDILAIGRQIWDASQLPRTAKGGCAYHLGGVYQAFVKRPLANAHGGLADARATLEVMQGSIECFQPLLEAKELPMMDGIKKLRDVIKMAKEKLPNKKDKQVSVMDRFAAVKSATAKRKRIIQEERSEDSLMENLSVENLSQTCRNSQSGGNNSGTKNENEKVIAHVVDLVGVVP